VIPKQRPTKSAGHAAGVLCALSCAVTVPPVCAQGYPAKPLRILVPNAPGGSTDILARIVGERLADKWGQQVVIDNRGGAGGNIAAELAARAAPDGYTLFLGSMSTQAVNPTLYAKLPFDAARDFAPVSLVANSANLLLVHPSIPANSVKQLIELARSHPGQLNYSSSGNGSFNHMSAELFKMMTHVDMTHIPYNGGAPALIAVVRGEAQLVFITTAPALPHVRSGRLKTLAVCAAKRHPLFPALPTASESGLPGFEVGTWYGILTPAATRADVVTKLNAAIAEIVKAPRTYQRLLDSGVEPASNTPDEFTQLIRRDTEKWAGLIKTIGAKAE
jgi:tripartite-type tricarboxylate transporter receptor subunit TctC